MYLSSAGCVSRRCKKISYKVIIYSLAGYMSVVSGAQQRTNEAASQKESLKCG